MFGLTHKIFYKVGAYGYPLFRKHKWDAGFDLCLPKNFEHKPYDQQPIVDFNVAVQLKRGSFALLLPRSSFSMAGGDMAIGVIDADYTGYLRGKFRFIPKQYMAGDRVAQLVIIPLWICRLIRVATLVTRGRGHDGFGSTGK